MSDTRTDRWVRVRTPSDEWGGSVVVGRVLRTYLGWLAYDDRHGESRISLHDTQEQATGAVRLRASKSAEDLDAMKASIVAHLLELRSLRKELDEPVTSDRVAAVLKRANDIGRLWELSSSWSWSMSWPWSRSRSSGGAQ